jgi:hypothetical protein
VRNELLDRFLNDYEQDRSDGKTIRSLHTALEKHTERDDERFDKVQAALLDIKPKSKRWAEKLIARPLTIVLIAVATIASHALLVRCNGSAKAVDARATSSKSAP